MITNFLELQVHYFTAELTKDSDVERLMKFATDTCSGLNVLVSFYLFKAI